MNLMKTIQIAFKILEKSGNFATRLWAIFINALTANEVSLDPVSTLISVPLVTSGITKQNTLLIYT